MPIYYYNFLLLLGGGCFLVVVVLGGGNRANCHLSELPTSTFLPYFVRFLKENTAVRFFLQKYVFFYFDFLFFIYLFIYFFIYFFLNTGSEIYTHYLCYENIQSF